MSTDALAPIDGLAEMAAPPQRAPRGGAPPARARRARRGRPRLGAPRQRASWSAPAAVWHAGWEAGERAEDGLARLAGAVGPLRRVLAAVAERLVATRAHERLCYARLSDYARERLGLSARQLQELARVHRALGALPRLEAALVANELPWSKVRLLARVATAEDEDAWVGRAQELTTRRLEEDVRAAAAPSAAPRELDDGESDVRVALRCTPAVHEKWMLAREMAERVAGERLRAGDALELVVAEALSGLAIDPAFLEPDTEPAGPRSPASAEAAPEGAPLQAARASAPQRPLPVAPLAAGLEEADAFELDRRLREAVSLEQTLDAAIAPLLRVVSSAEHEWCHGYQTLSVCASEQLGMSASKARALLRLERAGDACPELREAYRSGRLSWVKAQCLLPLLLLDIPGEWRPIWIAWAERVTVRRLETDVERALLLRAGHHQAWQRCKFHPERAQDPIPPGEQQMCAPDVDPEATQRLSWRVPRDVARLFRAVQETLRAKLRQRSGRAPTDGEVFDVLLDGALRAWSLREPGTRRPDPVIERDGYRCATPGCTSRRNLHDHHVAFRSAGGSDAPANRITLCAFHHQRCLHAGLLRVRGRAPDELVFELGLRGGAAPLARYRSGDVALAGPRPAA